MIEVFVSKKAVEVAANCSCLGTVIFSRNPAPLRMGKKTWKNQWDRSVTNLNWFLSGFLSINSAIVQRPSGGPSQSRSPAVRPEASCISVTFTGRAKRLVVEQCSRAPGWLFDIGDDKLPNYMGIFS